MIFRGVVCNDWDGITYVTRDLDGQVLTNTVGWRASDIGGAHISMTVAPIRAR